MTHHGSCHRGTCAFVADMNLAAVTTRCDCTICRKTRSWGTRADPATFRVTRGQDGLRLCDLQGDGTIAHAFPRKAKIPELGGAFATIQMAPSTTCARMT